jgi:hypothetical protein
MSNGSDRASQDDSRMERTSITQGSGQSSSASGLGNILYIITFQQCGCSITTSTFHWGLWLADHNNPTVGTLYHSSYISNQTVNSSIANIDHASSGNYRSGCIRMTGYRPSSSQIVRGVHPVARGVPDEEIDDAGQEADSQYSYNFSSNNCQNWVIRVLARLRDRGFITAQEYTRASTMPAPSHFANWNQAAESTKFWGWCLIVSEEMGAVIPCVLIGPDCHSFR